jgi:hypothetical protein
MGFDPPSPPGNVSGPTPANRLRRCRYQNAVAFNGLNIFMEQESRSSTSYGEASTNAASDQAQIDILKSPFGPYIQGKLIYKSLRMAIAPVGLLKVFLSAPDANKFSEVPLFHVKCTSKYFTD